MSTVSKILVAIDFSENSGRAIDTAIDYAKTFGASIDLVHAFNIPIPGITPYEVAIPDALILESREAAKQKLDAECARVQAAGVEAAAHLTEVPAPPSIAQVAEEIGADLLVVGTRGNTGLKHVLLGSVAERTLRHAPCAVLVIK